MQKMFMEFNYAIMTFNSTLRDMTSLNSASLRLGISVIVACSQ